MYSCCSRNASRILRSMIRDIVLTSRFRSLADGAFTLLFHPARLTPSLLAAYFLPSKHTPSLTTSVRRLAHPPWVVIGAP